jgi:DNA-binding PadR family transcriptional regulator
VVNPGGVLRRTIPLALVLVELDRADQEVCGVDVMTRTGLPPGTVYPILGRLAVDELVTELRKGNRVYLKLTQAGRVEAAASVLWAANQRVAAMDRYSQLNALLERAAAP